MKYDTKFKMCYAIFFETYLHVLRLSFGMQKINQRNLKIIYITNKLPLDIETISVPSAICYYSVLNKAVSCNNNVISPTSLWYFQNERLDCQSFCIYFQTEIIFQWHH